MGANITATLSGDIAKLDVFGAKVARAGSTATLRGLARAIGQAAVFEVQSGFQTRTDPYGEPWKPKVIQDGKPPLSGPTGKLRAGWRVVYAGPDAVIIANALPYAKFQNGTGVYGPSGRPITPKNGKALSWKSNGRRFAFRSVRGAPPRLMVPRSGDMPAKWSRPITTAAHEFMLARLLGK